MIDILTKNKKNIYIFLAHWLLLSQIRANLYDSDKNTLQRMSSSYVLIWHKIFCLGLCLSSSLNDQSKIKKLKGCYVIGLLSITVEGSFCFHFQGKSKPENLHKNVRWLCFPWGDEFPLGGMKWSLKFLNEGIIHIPAKLWR